MWKSALKPIRSIEIHSAQLKSGMPVIVEGSYGLADSTHVEVR